MPASTTAQTPAHASPVSLAAAVLRAFAANGLRRILVTGTFDDVAPARPAPPETGPALPGWRAELLVGIARALAGEPDGILVVQVSAPHPDPDRLRGVPARPGLWDLIHEVYLGDLTAERTAEFALGDWLEILDAQGRTGDLVVREEDEAFVLHFLRGSIRSIACPLPSGDEMGPHSTPQALAARRVTRMLSMPHPVFRFTEHPPSAAPEDSKSSLDGMLAGLREHLRYPFLARRIARHTMDTPLPNLKRITTGSGRIQAHALRRPLELLLNHLSRRFQFVLIDAPPVASSGPTPMLAGLVDAALLVASVIGVDSAVLIRAVDELRRGGSTKVAVLLVPPEAAASPNA